MMTATYSSASLSHLLPVFNASDLSSASIGPLQWDSRQVAPGDTFLAVAGLNTHGAQFIEDALAKGALCIMEEGEVADAHRDSKGVLRITVPALAQALSEIAGRFYDHPSRQMDIVAITGTNGKTTCAQWLAQLLNLTGMKSATVGTLGYGVIDAPLTETGFTTPDAVTTQRVLRELCDQNVTAVTLEASSHSLVQGRMADVAVDVAVLTNIGRDHLDYHGDMASYVQAKTSLMAFSSLQAAVINLDDAYAGEFQAAVLPGCRVITYGLQTAADFFLCNIVFSRSGIAASLHTPVGEFALSLSLWGQFNLSNLLAVTAAAYALGLPMAQIVEALPRLRSVPGRLQVIEAPSDITVLVDFAHTADALESVLQALKVHASGSLWCVFGCGGDRDKGKRPLMAAVAERLADKVIITSDNPRSEDPEQIIAEMLQGLQKPQAVNVIADRRAAIHSAILNAAPGDCVLLAGKGHEDYQLIQGQKMPFSDVAVAFDALQLRAVGGQP